MYFAKNEMIELNDDSQYLILDTIYLDDTSYYKVEKIENNKKTGKIIFITAINNEGKLYINNNLSSEILEKLEELSA